MGAGSQTIGAILAIVAAVISNIGTNVQKHSHTADEEAGKDDHVPYFKRVSWWTGFICTLVGSVLDFIALGLASQSLVAALGGGMTLITNVVVARFYNNEKTYWTDVTGVVFIIIGAVMFAVMAEPKPDIDSYEDQFFRKYNLIYLTCQLVVIFTLLASITGSRLAQWRRDYYSSLLRPLEAKIDHLEARLDSQEAKVKDLMTRSSIDITSPQHSDIEEPEDPMSKYRHRDKYIYVACAGTIGALSILFGGVTSSMMQDGFGAAFQNWFFFFSLLLMIVSVVTQTHLQNRGLALGACTAVFPVFEAFWISFGVVSGLVYYDTDATSFTSELKQAAGVAPMLIGTFFLFLHQDSQRGNVDAACAALPVFLRPSQDLSYMDAGTALSSSVNNIAEIDQKYEMYKPPSDGSSAARKSQRSASPEYADANQYRTPSAHNGDFQHI